MVDALRSKLTAAKEANIDTGYNIRPITLPASGMLVETIQAKYIPGGLVLGLFLGIGLAFLVWRLR